MKTCNYILPFQFDLYSKLLIAFPDCHTTGNCAWPCMLSSLCQHAAAQRHKHAHNEILNGLLLFLHSLAIFLSYCSGMYSREVLDIKSSPQIPNKNTLYTNCPSQKITILRLQIFFPQIFSGMLWKAAPRDATFKECLPFIWPPDNILCLR